MQIVAFETGERYGYSGGRRDCPLGCGHLDYGPLASPGIAEVCGRSHAARFAPHPDYPPLGIPEYLRLLVKPYVDAIMRGESTQVAANSFSSP